MGILLTVTALLISVSAIPNAEPLAIRCGRLIDGRGGVIQNAIVIVEGDRITKIGTEQSSIPANSKVIDLQRYTVIPGLIDAHTHMTYCSGKDKFDWIANPAVRVFLAQDNAKKCLETGVTTVRDLGAPEYTDIAMRDLINRGAMVGPRMYVCGYGLWATNEPYRPEVTRPSPGQADGVADVQRVARQQLAAGADWIKVYGSTGGGDDVTGFQTFSYEEMKAAVEVAHRAGKRAAIHSYGPEGARDAVRAGADSIEHAADMDDAAIKEMARKGTFYVPTVDHNRYYIDNREFYGYTEASVNRLSEFIVRNMETLRKAVRANVRIAMGSDANYTGFGQNTRELEWFVKAGMSPAQALATATTNGAALLGMEKTLGAVAPGYYADIVAVEGDPLRDIGAIVRGIKWVMKGGHVVVDKLATRQPEATNARR